MNSPIKLAKDDLEDLKKYYESIFNAPVNISRQISSVISEETQQHHFTGFYCLLFYSFSEAFAGSFMIASSLLIFVPGLNPSAIIAIALLFAFLDSLPTLCFQYRYIGESLGLDIESEKEKLAGLFIEQVKVLTQIKLELANVGNMDKIDPTQDYVKDISDFYSQLTNSINELFTRENPSFQLTCITYTLLFVGYISCGFTSYFMMNLILSSIAADLVGTYLGMSIMAISIALNLFIFDQTCRTDMNNFLRPENKIEAKLNSKMEQYKETSVATDDAINIAKNIVQHGLPPRSS